MQREELRELHYITDVSNLPSIEDQGILSHEMANKYAHKSVALKVVQERREGKIVPNARPLHHYVNLYFCARNPMMYLIRDSHRSLCVLRIDPSVVDIQGAIISDRNASSDWASFFPSPEGLSEVNGELVFARYWTDADRYEQMRKKSIKCAELLVPNRVEQAYITGVYASCEGVRTNLMTTGSLLQCHLQPDLFFQ